MALRENEEWFEHAILIYGPRKSGTTLLHNLVDGAQGIFVYPEELKLKRLVNVDLKTTEALPLYKKHGRIFREALPHFDLARYRSLWGRVKNASVTDLKSAVYLDLGFVRACADHQVADPHKWCAKEVSGGNTVAVIDWWAANFKHPQVVFVFRNPRLVTRATLNAYRQKKKKVGIRKLIRQTLEPLEVLKTQEQLLQSRAGVMAVVYEDLVTAPDRVMGELAEFLGVPAGEQLTRPTIFGESVRVRTASKQTSSIFVGDVKWTAGLTWRECIVVWLASKLAWFNPKLRVDYKAMVARVAAFQGQAVAKEAEAPRRR